MSEKQESIIRQQININDKPKQSIKNIWSKE